MAVSNYASGPDDSYSGGSQTEGPLDLSKYISGVTDRAYKNWGRAEDQYQWAKDQYAKDRGITDQVTQRALDTQAKMGGWADEDRAFWTGTYKPAMEQQMAYAREYTTPGRMDANRGAAMAGSNLAFDSAADMAKRNLSSYGVDPSSGRYAGLDAGLAAKRAAGAAAAGTKSDRDTEMLGQEYLDRAIRTGASLPGQAGNFEGIGMAAGNQAVNAGLATTASGANTMGRPTDWAGLGNDMYKEWSRAAQAQTQAGLQGQELELKRKEAEGKESSGMGAALGAGMGILGKLGSSYMSGGMGGMMGGGGGMMGGGSGMTFERGGVVPKQKRIKKFFSGGFSGFSAPDIQPIDWGGGQAFDPYDPGASLWGAFDNDNPELEDNEGEGIGRGVGGQVGGMVGQIWGPIGQMAGREIGQKVGGGVGAAVQGDWGGAAESLVEGTPFDMFFRAGGAVPEIEETKDRNIRRGYRPGVRDKAAKFRTMPQDTTMQDRFERPDSDTNVEGQDEPNWVPNYGDDPAGEYEEGGRVRQIGREVWGDQIVPAYAEGGEVEDDMVDTPDDEGLMPEGEMPEDEMGMGPPPQEANVVPPEASPSGGEETDDVHALLNEGEFVIPKKVVNWHGEKFFQKLIEKAYNEMAGPKTAEPEEGPPMQAMAISPPSFQSAGG